MVQYETILKYEGSDAANRYLGKYGVDIQVGSYKDLRKQKGKSNRQVHHLNQNVALYESLQYAGISKMNAAYATTRAIGQQKKNKVGVYVPRVPGKMRQKKGVNRHERSTEIRYGRCATISYRTFGFKLV